MKLIKIISTILCIIIGLTVFSSVAFASNSADGNFIFNPANIFGEGKISNAIRSAESVYDAFNVPEPPLWHTILFLPVSLLLVAMMYVLFPSMFSV